MRYTKKEWLLALDRCAQESTSPSMYDVFSACKEAVRSGHFNDADDLMTAIREVEFQLEEVRMWSSHV